MQKIYYLKGLCCPDCGSKIEAEAARLKGINSSVVNMIKCTLTIEGENFDGDINAKIKKIVKINEPKVKVIEKSNEEGKNAGSDEDKKNVNEKKYLLNKDMKIDFFLLRFIFGALVFLTAFFLKENEMLSFSLFFTSYVILGYDVLISAARNIFKGRVFDENFLMSLATVGAFAIGEYPEAAGVMLFYQIGEYFQDRALENSKKSISKLMDIRSDYANLIINGEVKEVSPYDVKIGDIIIVKPGEKIPLDGVIEKGCSTLDTTALTGESVPRDVEKGEDVISGCINQRAVLEVKVTKSFRESTVSKILDLVENSAAKKAKTENFITSFSKYYTPIVVIIAIIIAFLPPLLMKLPLAGWLNRGLVFLVISCPCALVISIPLSFFGGIGGASKRGILVKGGNYLEALNRLDTVVFDKTGTLTKGVFKVRDIIPNAEYLKEEILELAAFAEAFSNHPIAKSILSAYGKTVYTEKISSYTEIPGRGIRAVVDGKKVLAGNKALLESDSITLKESENSGTKIYIACENKFLGCILIADEIKEGSTKLIRELKNRGIKKIVMLTGDNEKIAKEVAAEIGIDEVHFELLPNEKADIFEKISNQKSKSGKTAFVGDGINDAPVLALADIGIAMGGLGSDAAIEAADIVLMTDEPNKIIEALEIAKFTRKIVWQNIYFALAVKGIFLVLGAFGVAGMWEAVFSDVGVALLAVFNAMRIIGYLPPNKAL